MTFRFAEHSEPEFEERCADPINPDERPAGGDRGVGGTRERARGRTASTYLYLKSADAGQMDLDAITSSLTWKKDVLQTWKRMLASERVTPIGILLPLGGEFPL